MFFFFFKKVIINSRIINFIANIIDNYFILLKIIPFEKFLRVNVWHVWILCYRAVPHTGGGGENSFLEKTISHIIRQKEFTLFSVWIFIFTL